jgi:hypothetical protein
MLVRLGISCLQQQQQQQQQCIVLSLCTQKV